MIRLRTSNRRTIHDFKLCDCFALVILIRRSTSRFSSDDRQLHMFDFYPNEQEENLANDDIFQVIPLGKVNNFHRNTKDTHLDLLYSNSICKLSSIPTSILIELLLSGGILNECTQISRSFTTSANRRDIFTRIKYLRIWIRLVTIFELRLIEYTHLSLTLIP